ncbi:MAG TPA: SGNH/GDSL hydrolase family protein [Bryobacteraceae bacterium]|jgi:lysophospholipase L1-like esterase|nr:SGNH/GDSL hydrolase family protein [Bryobacteraceae bacterium]
MRTPLLITAIALSACGTVNAQLVGDFDPPRANCCLVNTAKSLANQLEDWNQLGRFHLANQELARQPADPRRVVFMGDSITDLWKLDEQFPGQRYVNRGIGGQTTPQMLVRMYPDVIDLKPAIMVFLGGTNDIAGNTGPSTEQMIEENIMAMTELAQSHGIKVILCSIMPVSDYPYEAQQSGQTPPPRAGTPGRGPFPRMRMTVNHPPGDILKLNAWMKSYAAQVKAIYADYFSALVDDRGWLKDGYSADGLHPNAKGYNLMAPVVTEAIHKALP